jgi:hypothetical protein
MSSGVPGILLLQISHLLTRILSSLSSRAALTFQILIIACENNIIVD